ncbi:MogA/MoaB family molybdenum cofactor biosynthesis protein [Lagierella sp.]|uniref:MogA/MoaB family molybdenum cofactor biosynthesis protein n=1 Tax=Lagierella sp. TaxID=2849657 RepID=UPI002628217F|nr:MogA/MoaB family molybdenum cofactor biosynthesis protein [Lagierella sp.]
MFYASIITVSDKGSKGERTDESGMLISEILKENGYHINNYCIVPDEIEEIKRVLIDSCDNKKSDLVLTTGGTGFSPRDNTPEATMEVMTKNAPGIAEAIRSYSMGITKRAMLSRGASVIRNQSLIINLPGSPKAVREALEYILADLDHGLKILKSMEGECGKK